VSAARLTPSMTVRQFDNGYWYATELKRFAHAIGIASAARLRKDHLEDAIRQFLRTRRIAAPQPPAPGGGTRDVDLGLRLDRRVVRYTNDPQTKAFLEREAAKMSPGYRRRSGARYRLNRWRDAQLAAGRAITYRDLVREYVRLSAPDAPYARIPHTRYVYFLGDFMRGEPGATRGAALRAWRSVKRMDCPKTYAAWRRVRGAR
jgi:hypothetical protein